MDGFCKACLVKYEDLSQLLQYTEKNRRLFVYSTGLQLKQNDPFPLQLCQSCYLKMKIACQFKKQCRTSDKRLTHFLSLREAGEDTDFCTYLQNNDGSLLFKFPLNGQSTPSDQKPKDDDNVSTSTSIRNFMTDFLREDAVPDTEARIIREMIEQEADVLDESLDSQWLQDDISIASDFRFSPYSTPQPKYNYQPLLNYSPVKEEKQVNEEQNRNTRDVLAAKKLLLSPVSCSTSETLSPRSQLSETDKNTFIAAKKILLNPKLSSSESQTESIKSKENIDHDTFIAKKRILLNCKSNNKEINLDKEKEERNSYIRNVLTAKKPFLSPLSCSTRQTQSPRSQLGETDQNTLAAKKIILNPKLSSSESQAESLTKSRENIVAKKRILLNAKSNKKELYLEDDMETYLAAKHILNSFNSSGDENTAKSPRNIAVKAKCESLAEIDLNQGVEIAHKGFYVENVETTDNMIQIADFNDAKTDAIDKNIEKILNNTSDEVISLSALLASPSSEFVPICKDTIATPSVHQGLSGANTPTIDNILFGETLDDNQNSNRKELDQPNKDIVSDIGDKSGILDDFFNKETGKYIGENEQKQEDEMFEEFKNPYVNLPKPGQCQYDLTDFSCKKCNIQFKSEKGLKIHLAKAHNIKLMRIRNKEPRVEMPCHVCGRIFSLKSNLTKHIKVMHINPKTAQVCTVCSLEFTSEARLKIHMDIHNGVKKKKDSKSKYNLICNICGHVSTHPGNLKTHIARHNKTYRFTCDLCQAGFYRKSDLQIHMRIHLDKKPFKCAQCSERFRRKDQLQIHLKNHAGERPYICEICDKRFVTSSKLKNHMKKSITCQNIKQKAALKENKAIEDSIEQLYVAEALVTLGNEKIKEITKNAATAIGNEEITDNAAADDELEDITMEDLLETKKGAMAQDDDKISLSDMFTIPIIIKDEI